MPGPSLTTMGEKPVPAVSSGGILSGELLWDVDLTALPNADWNATPLTNLAGLDILMTDGGQPWGPSGGAGVTVQAGYYGRIRPDGWSAIEALMNRPLTRHDQLVFAHQHSVASNNVTQDYSNIRLVVLSDVDTDESWVGLERKAGGGGNRIAGHYRGGWPPSYLVRDVDLNMRSAYLQLRTDTTVRWTSQSELSTSTINPGTDGPWIGRGGFTGQSPDLQTDEPTGSYDWDFVAPKGYFWWQISAAAGETQALHLERIQIWLLSHQPNVVP